jgi:hypothetical protein
MLGAKLDLGGSMLDQLAQILSGKAALWTHRAEYGKSERPRVPGAPQPLHRPASELLD